MKSNNIIFADLSTYSPIKTMSFYEAAFGWQYIEDNGYYLAYKGDKEVAGLYETPEKFKQMRMPHFWMTYIQVNDVEATVEKARELGGIVELVDLENSIGKIALIRDPQGAGFTIYEGAQLQNTRTESEPQTLIWNELHVSDLTKIIPFYQGIFNWKFVETKNQSFAILNDKEEHIADALRVPNELKGKYEYWVCTFGVKDLKATKQKVLECGGTIVLDEGKRILFTDNSGEAFFYTEEVE